MTAGDWRTDPPEPARRTTAGGTSASSGTAARCTPLAGGYHDYAFCRSTRCSSGHCPSPSRAARGSCRCCSRRPVRRGAGAARAVDGAAVWSRVRRPVRGAARDLPVLRGVLDRRTQRPVHGADARRVPRAERAKAIPAGILLALATLTRLQGAALIVPLAWLLWDGAGGRWSSLRSSFRPSWLALLLGPAAARRVRVGIWLTGDTASYASARARGGRARWRRSGRSPMPREHRDGRDRVHAGRQFVVLLGAVFLLVCVVATASRGVRLVGVLSSGSPGGSRRPSGGWAAPSVDPRGRRAATPARLPARRRCSPRSRSRPMRAEGRA